MKKIALMMLVAIAAIACNKQDEIVPEINVTTTEFTIPVEGSEEEAFLVQFNANVDWTAALKEVEAAEWCTITASSGVAGNASIGIVAVENETKEIRTATLVITAGTAVKEVVLTQDQVDAFELVKEFDYVAAEGGAYELKVKTNVPYEVTVDVDWVTVASTKAFEEKTTTLNVNPYDVVEGTRVATLTLTAEGIEPLEFVLYQEGPEAKVWGLDLRTVATRHSTVTNAVAETFNATYSLALFGDDLVLCVGDGTAPIILDKETGAKKGTLDVGDAKPYAIANDDAGNLVLANRVYNYWTSYEFYTVWYIKAGTSEVVKLFDIYSDFEYYTSYIGAGITVSGDVTTNAVIASAFEGYPGVSGENMLLVFDVKGGTPEMSKLTLTGFKTLTWWEGYWVEAAGNYPGFAFLGTSSAEGGLLVGYDANIVHTFDATGACTAITEPLADGNYAANVLELEKVGNKTLLAVATGCQFPDYGISPVMAVYDLETKSVVATPKTTNYATDDYVTYLNAASPTSDIVIEAVDGGFNVYYVDNNCSAVEAFHYEF